MITILDGKKFCGSQVTFSDPANDEMSITSTDPVEDVAVTFKCQLRAGHVDSHAWTDTAGDLGGYKPVSIRWEK